MMKFYKLLAYSICLLTMMASVAYGEVPVTTDSRIKIFVYNENEVFHLTIHYGYQSNIEFGPDEEIETISMGDSYTWKITPIGRRLFIKPMEVNVRTNMTVITNKHTYQFDIISKMPNDKVDNELVYVARFFYPENNIDRTTPAFSGASVPVQMPQLPPQMQMQMQPYEQSPMEPQVSAFPVEPGRK